MRWGLHVAGLVGAGCTYCHGFSYGLEWSGWCFTDVTELPRDSAAGVR